MAEKDMSAKNVNNMPMIGLALMIRPVPCGRRVMIGMIIIIGVVSMQIGR